MKQQTAVQFDPQRRAARPDLKASIEAFARRLESEERRLEIRTRARRELDQRNFRLAVEAIACNLLVTAMIASGATLSVPRSHGVMWGKGRYSNPVFGQHFLDVLSLLEELSLIYTVTKGFRFSKNATQPTTISARVSLSAHLPLGATDLTAFRHEEELEVIVLKPPKDDDGHAPPIEYKDTRDTKRWRREVKTINEWLKAAPITILEDDPAIVRVDREGQPVEPYRRSLRRVFNNATWRNGGRIFGGFWMTMERIQRFRRLRIAEEEIANVDFSSLFPRMAYVRARVEQPTDDLYDVTGDGTCRDDWKKLVNALLFADKPLRGWREELPIGIKLREAIEAIKRKHTPIARLFEQGLGFELMRLESDLLISVLTALFKNGITALPLHDSVLVARSHAETAKAFMEQEFMHRSGSSRAFVKIDFGPN
jgi:hypothetical protein